MQERVLRAGLVLLIGAVVVVLLHQGADHAAALAGAWDGVPERTSAQLEDLAPGEPVIQTVALAVPNDASGLAVYELQEAHTHTTTDSNGNRTTHTDWDTISVVRPASIAAVLVPELAVRITVTGGALGGARRTVDQGWSWGQHRRAVGWASGDALVVTGRLGPEPVIINASEILGGTSVADYKAGKHGWAGVLRVLEVVAGIGAAVIMVAVGLGWGE